MPDFFVLSKLVPLLLYPLPLFLILIFGLTWFLRKNPVRWIVRTAVLAFWIISTPWFADLTSKWWEAPRKTPEEIPAISDVAIVLGGMSDPALSTEHHLEWGKSAERLTEAVGLWRQGRVRSLLITSGSGDPWNQDAKEAPGLAAWARSMGVPPEALLVESQSRNTRENAVLSLPLAEARGYKTFVLITSAGHMRRSEAIFLKAGYASEGRTLVTWPVDTQTDSRRFPLSWVADPGSLATVQSHLKEAIGYLVYRVQGYL